MVGLKICLATHKGIADDYRRHVGSDYLIRESLEERGAQCDMIPWDATNVQWEDYDLVICRSVWDYPYVQEKFSDWVMDMKRRGINLHNKTEDIMWNMDKRYIFDLKKRETNVPESVFIQKVPEHGEVPQISYLLEKHCWKQAFVKPILGNCAMSTFTITDPRFDQEEFAKNVHSHSVIVQEFEPGYRHGEICLIFFDGKFSHAINKEASTAVHSFTYHEPTEDEFAMALKVISYFEDPPLQARVDLVRRDDGTLILGEVELIDPALYLTKTLSMGFADSIIKKYTQVNTSKYIYKPKTCFCSLL